jgi:hypothetical protein
MLSTNFLLLYNLDSAAPPMFDSSTCAEQYVSDVDEEEGLCPPRKCATVSRTADRQLSGNTATANMADGQGADIPATGNMADGRSADSPAIASMADGQFPDYPRTGNMADGLSAPFPTTNNMADGQSQLHRAENSTNEQLGVAMAVMESIPDAADSLQVDMESEDDEQMAVLDLPQSYVHSTTSSEPDFQNTISTSYNSSVLRNVYLALLALYVAHAPSELLFSNIIRIVNLLIPKQSERLPVKLTQFLRRTACTSAPTRHYYCSRSTCAAKYVGTADAYCSVCGSKPERKSYFLYSSVEHYLRSLLQDSDLSHYLSNTTESCAVRTYADVSDGSEFKRVQAASPGCIQLLLNVDGVPLYSTSSSTLLPVTICPLNYPLTIRRKRLFTCLIWCDKRKPNFTELLKPFLREMRKLGTTGLLWKHNDVFVNTKAFLTIVTSDSVARAPLQQLQQFNGKYGCPVCLTSSTPISTKNALHRIYNYRAEPILRNSKDTLVLAAAKLVILNCILFLLRLLLSYLSSISLAEQLLWQLYGCHRTVSTR